MSENTVRKLHAEPAADSTSAEKTPALGMSLQVDLGAGRVCTLQTYLERDCSVVELNKMLFKMTGAGDCQRAHYQIEGLLRDLAKHEQDQAQAEADLAQMDVTFGAEQAERAKTIEKHGATIGQFQEAHRAVADVRGVRDASRLKSTEAANIAKLENAIKDLRAEMQVAPERLKNEIEQARIVMRTRQGQIDKLKRDIEHNRGIVAAGLQAPAGD